jgi:thiaminase/transcriptional activator TenA
MTSAPFALGDGLFARLVAAGEADWRAYVDHPFVAGLADGRLPGAAFRHYLIQDYLFLKHFCRAYGLAVYKAEELADMRAFTGTLDAILNHEMALHVTYSAEWGLTAADLERATEATETLAYTRYVLDQGLGGDLLDLMVALSPCVIGYAVIACAIQPQAAADTPYRAWINMYAGAEYRAVASDTVALIDRLGRTRGGDARFARLAEGFATACRLEAGFWQMGLDAAT